MDNTVEFILKLKDLASGGMGQFAAKTQSAVAAVDTTLIKAQKDMQRLGEMARSATPEIAAMRNAMATPPQIVPGALSAIKEIKREAKDATKEVMELKRGVHDAGAGGSAGGHGSLLGSIIGGNLIAGGITRGAGIAKDFIGSSIGAAMDFQAQSKSFEVLTGDAKKGHELVGQLRELKQTTIMGASVYKNAQTMMGFGVGSGEVIKDLRMIGDISMGDVDRMQSLTLAFSQTRASGKLMGQDLLQYINAGFNPLKVMSDHWQQFGLKQAKTVGQLKDMMEEGKISSAAVTKAFDVATSKGGQFYGMMEQIGNTSAGQLQKLKGNFAAFKIDAGNLIMPVASSFMEGANSCFISSISARPYLSNCAMSRRKLSL